MLPGESGERFARLVPRIHREHDQPVVGMGLDEVTDVRSLRTTGRSPQRPQSEHDRFTTIIAKADRSAVQRLQGKRRGRLVVETSGHT